MTVVSRETVDTDRETRARAALAELTALREFYSAWRFFHETRNVKSDMGEKWDRTRLEMAAQALTDAADKVAAL